MKNKKIIIGAVIALLAVAGLGWLHSHYVIHTDRGYIVIHKQYLSFSDSWVDARAWGTTDFNQRPLLKEAMVQQGYGDYLADLRWQEWRQTAANARDSVRAWWQRQVQGVQNFWTRLTACHHDREKQPQT